MKYNHNRDAQKIKIRVIWFVKNMCIRRYGMNWITHKPSFEFDNFSHIIWSQSAWSGHLDFVDVKMTRSCNIFFL